MMRMWMIPSVLLCDQHLLGEHKEQHMLVGSILKGFSLQGYIDSEIVALHLIRERHEESVAEMDNRGFGHASELVDYPPQEPTRVDPRESIRELARRCIGCRRRMCERPELLGVDKEYVLDLQERNVEPYKLPIHSRKQEEHLANVMHERKTHEQASTPA